MFEGRHLYVNVILCVCKQEYGNEWIYIEMLFCPYNVMLMVVPSQTIIYKIFSDKILNSNNLYKYTEIVLMYIIYFL